MISDDHVEQTYRPLINSIASSSFSTSMTGRIGPNISLSTMRSTSARPVLRDCNTYSPIKESCPLTPVTIVGSMNLVSEFVEPPHAILPSVRSSNVLIRAKCDGEMIREYESDDSAPSG